MKNKTKAYIKLLRLDKPIGIFLLLWPTLWGLWLGAQGVPETNTLIVFIIGVFLARTTGCVINDIADRDLDKHVKRTKNRPLTSGEVTLKEAIIVFIILLFSCTSLLLFINIRTAIFAIVAGLLMMIYPFLKRMTHFPQIVLGFIFAGIPILMGFSETRIIIPNSAWLIFFAGTIWQISYDTIYAMVDREDDVKVSVKSLAILLGDYDRIIIAILQSIFLILMLIAGFLFQLHFIYYVMWGMSVLLIIYQQYLISQRIPEKCFKAFLNNHWLAMILFLGIMLSDLI